MKEKILTQILLITPLQKENNLLAEAFAQQGYTAVTKSAGKMKFLEFPELGIYLARGGHGKAQFAVQTQYLIDRIPGLQLVICAGASGVLVPELEIGDVVIGTSTIEHDYYIRFMQRPAPVFNGHAPTCETIMQIVKNSALPFSVHFGRIASGDEDIVTNERAGELAKQTAALCVAWEGAGAARACAFSKLPFIEIRSITDSANKSANQDFNQNLKLAMNNLAAFLVSWLAEK